ncbi:MAG TPA: hypothetical protein PKA83_15710 [Pirellulaceae bacterium]|nr:hypothetical protein [Pirellulaceae bacterium]
MASKINLERLSRMWWHGLWPGLARLWLRGDFSAWITAAGFTILLNLALVSTFLWPKWLGTGFSLVAWPLVLVVWFGSAIVAFFQYERIVQLKNNLPNQDDTLLIEAQSEYLKGNWSRVQALISRHLHANTRDIPARLLLASMFRHTGNWGKATQQLEIIDRFDESVPWQFEIAKERELIEKTIASLEESQDVDPGHSPNDQQENNLDNNQLATKAEFMGNESRDPVARKAA